MAIPDYETLMLPLLRCAATGAVDIQELTRLMVQFNVGVRVQRVVEIKRIDLEYFEGPDSA